MEKKYTRHHYDFDTLPWLTSPRRQLDLQSVALGFINLPPNEGYTFTHTHREQEEVYVVIRGSGQILLDEELLNLVEGDIVRVSPETRRALKANSHGIFIICSGAVPSGYPRNPNARYLIDDGIADYNDIPPWYQGDPAVAERNSRLQQRQMKTRAKKPSER
ncbi:MAG: cupin domain-containing protein [Desulforhopalus sp.]